MAGIDAALACADPGLRAKAFASLETGGTALFFWKYLRSSKWHNNKFQFRRDTVPPHRFKSDEYHRCVEKVSQDWAFVDVTIAPKMLEVSDMTVQYSTIDKISIPGTCGV